MPLVWEPFQVATPREESGGLRPLLDALDDPAFTAHVDVLAGYDIAGAGEVVDVSS